MSHSSNTLTNVHSCITINVSTETEDNFRMRVASESTVRSIVERELRMNPGKVDIFVNGSAVDLEDILDDGDSISVRTKHYNSGLGF